MRCPLYRARSERRIQKPEFIMRRHLEGISLRPGLGPHENKRDIIFRQWALSFFTISALWIRHWDLDPFVWLHIKPGID